MAKFQESQLFSNKKISIIISFVVALTFWFIITLVENPNSERVLNGVQLYLDTNGTVVGQQGLSIVNETEDIKYVSVKISGARYVVNSVTPEDILVTPSYEDVNAAGKYSIKLNPTNNSTKSFTIESVTPSSMDLELDYIDTITMDVQIKVKGAVAADGLSLGTERFTNTEKASLEISGPRAVVSTISEVYAEVEADKNQKLSATKSYEANIVLYNKRGKKVNTENLTLNFDKINVSVPVLKTKTVPVRCSYLNKPQGYTPVATLTVDGKEINKITIEGAPDIIDQTTFVELESIDFFNVSKKRNTFQKAFVLPSGVSVVDDIDVVKVKLNTSEIANKKIKVNNVVAINNPENLKVSLVQPLSVVVCGKESTINQLNDSNFYAEINLDGKAEGEQSVTVVIKTRDRDNVWQYGNYEAKISVKK